MSTLPARFGTRLGKVDEAEPPANGVGLTPLPPDQQRVSDGDRHAVAERLREAAGEGRLDLEELDERLGRSYAARTYADLAVLTRDLPNSARSVPGPAPQGASLPARIGGVPGARQSWAVMSGVNRRGSWVVPRTYTVVAMMGGAQIDLTAATLESREVVIRVVAMMGGAEIIVPPDVSVVVDGFGLMGGFDDARSDATLPVPGAPVVRITGVAVMGGVSVRRPKPGGTLGIRRMH